MIDPWCRFRSYPLLLEHLAPLLHDKIIMCTLSLFDLFIVFVTPFPSDKKTFVQIRHYKSLLRDCLLFLDYCC